MSHQVVVSQAISAALLRTADGSDLCYQMHSHDEFSFGLIVAGNAEYQNMGQSFQIHTGDVVTVNPNDAHSCNPADGPWSYKMVYLQASWVEEFLRCQPGRFAQPLVRGNEPVGRELSRELAHVFTYLWHSPSVFECEALLGQWLIKVLDLHHYDLAAQPSAAIAKIATQIAGDLQAKGSLSELAGQHGLSKFQLIRQFKQAYGQTPHSYLIDQRIKAAKPRLAQGERLADIAYEVGFADQAHFQRVFKQRFALTPQAYQQAYR